MADLGKESGFNNDNIVNLKEAIEDGLTNIIQWFKEKISESLSKNSKSFEVTMNELEETRKINQQELMKSIKVMNEKLENFIQKLK
jgi:hypothetical protein